METLTSAGAKVQSHGFTTPRYMEWRVRERATRFHRRTLCEACRAADGMFYRVRVEATLSCDNDIRLFAGQKKSAWAINVF